ncbi:MAG: glucuronate isomerase [Lentisphaeria bacterium]|nr:glucuronate isomerase [Lentisphaeria bacterium]
MYRNTLSDLAEAVMGLPVWDTHNHLRGGDELSASSFWDIAHYFWFRRELDAAGYPGTAADLPEDRRTAAFLDAFEAGRNTSWNQAVRAGLRELFGIEVRDAADIQALNRRIAEKHRDPAWPVAVAERAGLHRLVVERGPASDYGMLADRVVPMGVCYLLGGKWAEPLVRAGGAARAVEAYAAELVGAVEEAVADGRRAMRMQWVFEHPTRPSDEVPRLAETGNSREDMALVLGHRLLAAMDRLGCHVQLFIGMVRGVASRAQGGTADRSHARNDTGRVAGMHPVFEMYPGCTFEVFNAAELSSLDLVQAARLHGNVIPGGLWWFAFRASVYRANMQYRIEALPANRSTFLATDARCIEWAYIKTRLVKRLLAEFLDDQVRRGWLDEDAALHTARCWLHDTASRLYRDPSGGATGCAGAAG